MTFQQLHYILEIYRTGSISRAAENLFVTRPGVSLSLRNLEAELGYPIFVRTQQGLVPSPQGEMVLEYASRICETQELISGIGKERKNRIEVSCVFYRPVRWAIQRLLEENRGRKDIAFSFKTNYADPLKKLAFFELDAVISARFENYSEVVEEGMLRRKLAWRELRQIPVSIVIGKGHPLYEKKDLTPKDFDGDVLLETPGMNLRKCVFLNEHVRWDPTRAIVTNDSGMKNELLQQGVGFSIQRTPGPDRLARYNLRCIPLPGVFQQLRVVTNPMRPLRPEVERFIQLLEEELENYTDPVALG